MDALLIPGISAAIVKDGSLAWSRGFGMADVGTGAAMHDDTLINVASISKLVVNAAVLQLWEMGSLELDTDLNAYLPFSLKNTAYPDTPITTRQLLNHTSSILDGDALGDSYACGDPVVSLADWIEGYFTPGGDYNNPERTFWNDAPGTRYRYSNVGYGLLGYLVERISGEPFEIYTRKALFDRLDMIDSAWHLSDVDISRHAKPQAYFQAGQPTYYRLIEGAEPGDVQAEDGYKSLCLYSFYNYPDGLLRTNVIELAKFMLAHAGDGSHAGARILESDTRDAIFTNQGDRGPLGGDSIQGMTWHTEELGDGSFPWGHSGSDPGVSTLMLLNIESSVGVVVLANRGNQDLLPIVEELFVAAAAL
jgi:CubicO group peptidase (beta-lactamase class C family)